MGVKKIGGGNYIIYLEECPKCGTNRTFNKEMMAQSSKLAIGSIILTFTSGNPIIGAAWAKLMKTINKDEWAVYSKKKIFYCPKCGCTELIYTSNPVQKIATLRRLLNQLDFNITELRGAFTKLKFWQFKKKNNIREQLEPLYEFYGNINVDAQEAIDEKNEDRIDSIIQKIYASKPNKLNLPVRKKIVKIISKKLNIPKDMISYDNLLISDLGCDELDIIELTMKIEEWYNIEISDEDAETFSTVMSVIDYVNDRIN